jgi:RNA polymerase sigma-70 factor (ECF subfamily)
VRNLSLKRYHANTAVKRNSSYDVALEEMEHCLSGGKSVEEELEAKELARVIEAFLDTLSEENRVVFMRRYWFADSYSDIAKLTKLDGVFSVERINQ